MPRKPESFIKNPIYPGGRKAMDEFIKSNMRYPEEAMANRIEGTVTVDYDVDALGKVILTKLKHGIGYGCDEEALRLVSMLQFSKKKYSGVRVVFHQTIGIHFRLNDAVKLPDPVQTITYNYVSKENPTPGYTITIKH
jgi:TonB family protein